MTERLVRGGPAEARTDAGTIVDARGMRCPWPALRLARAMRDGAPVRLIADDPIAPREVAALCAERGWTLERIGRDVFRVRCAGV